MREPAPLAAARHGGELGTGSWNILLGLAARRHRAEPCRVPVPASGLRHREHRVLAGRGASEVGRVSSHPPQIKELQALWLELEDRFKTARPLPVHPVPLILVGE